MSSNPSLSQLEDVPLPGSQQVASIRRLLHSLSCTTQACSSVMCIYCTERIQFSCFFQLHNPKLRQLRFFSVCKHFVFGKSSKLESLPMWLTTNLGSTIIWFCFSSGERQQFLSPVSLFVEEFLVTVEMHFGSIWLVAYCSFPTYVLGADFNSEFAVSSTP